MPEAPTIAPIGPEAPVAPPSMPAVERPGPQIPTVDTSSLQSAAPHDALQDLASTVPGVEATPPGGVLAQAEAVSQAYQASGAESSVVQAAPAQEASQVRPVEDRSEIAARTDRNVAVLKATNYMKALGRSMGDRMLRDWPLGAATLAIAGKVAGLY